MSLKGGPDPIEETEAEKAQAEVAGEQWADRQRFIPVEQAFMKDVEVTEPERAKARGMASADVAQATDGAYARTAAVEGASGAAPGSGAFTGALGDVGLHRGAAGGQSQVAMEAGLEDLEQTGGLKVVRLGRNQADMADTGLRQLSRISSSKARSSARAAGVKRDARLGALGTVTGVGTRMGLEKWGGGE